MKKLTICIIAIMMATLAYADDIRQISIITNDIIYDPFSLKIYASVPSSAGSIGNSILSIDPYTGTIGSPVFVGSEPNKLTISDDGQYLYVSLDGAAAVRRFDIQTQTAGLQFSLGNDPSTGPYFVEDMEVLPGNSEAVAISRRNEGFSPKHEGVAIYDNGVQRPTTTPDHTGSNVIEFSSSASLLYGYNNETTEYGFRRMSVDGSGVSVVDVTGDLISEFYVDIKFDNGLIYATSGRVIDPEARVLVGTFTGFPTYGTLAKPDSKAGRVFFLTESTLLGYDLDTFLPVGSLDIPGVSGATSSLIRWGTRGLAFRTSDKVFLVHTMLIPAPQADFDRDIKTDIAVYHSNTGLWFIKKSSDGSDYYVGYGGSDYKPVPGDYDGDGKTDVAVYYSASGLWFIKKSSDGADYYVGYGGLDYKPVPADYDGDGKTDVAAYHSGSGLWFIKKSSDGTDYTVGYGGPEYKPVPADYDGDGKTDVAVYHSASGLWFIKPSSGAGDYSVGYGGTGYIPVPGDYDGDGKVDVAVYHSDSGLWFIKPSSGGADYYASYGGSDYVPVNLDYLLGWIY